MLAVAYDRKSSIFFFSFFLFLSKEALLVMSLLKQIRSGSKVSAYSNVHNVVLHQRCHVYISKLAI